MPQIISYNLIAGTDTVKFYEAVRKAIQEGWQPYGPLLMRTVSTGNWPPTTTELVREMVKYA